MQKDMKGKAGVIFFLLGAELELEKGTEHKSSKMAERRDVSEWKLAVYNCGGPLIDGV